MSKRKLLLADDSITIQKVVNLTFADEGIEVISVGDGDSAMRKFDEFFPDLVMADVNMPGLNGYEMCQIIKQNDETNRIPVILLVGSFEPFDEDQARFVGADDYLTKPFQSIRQLVNKVTDLLNKTENGTFEAETAETAPAIQAAAEPGGDTFAETLEMPADKIQAEFGDAGMDDEMIETSRADYGDSPVSSFHGEAEEYPSTPPLKAEDLKPFNFSEVGETAAHEIAERDNFEETPAADRTAAPEYSSGTGESGREDVAEAEEKAENGDAESEPAGAFGAETVEENYAGENRIPDSAQPESEPEAAATAETDYRTDYRTEASENDDRAGERQDAELYSQPETAYHSSEEESLETQNESYRTLDAEESIGRQEQHGEPRETETNTEMNDEDRPAEIDDRAPETDPSEDVPQSEIQTAEKIPLISFDDGDLLELPPLVEETGIRPQFAAAKPEPEVAAAPAPAPVPNFPPELIEAIAQRVAEKISGQTIREIASQLVPQVSEMLAQEMTQEVNREKPPE